MVFTLFHLTATFFPLAFALAFAFAFAFALAFTPGLGVSLTLALTGAPTDVLAFSVSEFSFEDDERSCFLALKTELGLGPVFLCST